MLPIAPVTIQFWAGREVRALREVSRMSIRAFSAHLSVSERMVSKWEKGGDDIRPRPVNQPAPDSSLATCGAEDQTRFSVLLGLAPPGSAADDSPLAESTLLDHSLHARHPIDGRLMTLVEDGICLACESNEPVWLRAFYIDVFPTTNLDRHRFTQATNHPVPQHWPRTAATDTPARSMTPWRGWRSRPRRRRCVRCC